jgi:hypothetical protein
MKLFYQISCIALTCFGSMNTLLANTFFAQVTHSEKAPNICETSSYLDYLEWDHMEELYKQATTLASTQTLPVAQKNVTAPQKISEIPLPLFTFPKLPEVLCWFWMSRKDTVKKEKIQHFIEEAKPLSAPKPAEKLFEMIVQQGIRKNHKHTVQKVRELLTRSKSTPVIPFVESLIKQLDNAEFDGLIEKMRTSSKGLEANEKVIFWENIGKITDPSKQLELLEQAPKFLLKDKECASFFQTFTAKPLIENTVDQILQNTDFLRVLSDEMLKKMLQQKEKYARENFWLQQISHLATEKNHLFDVEVLNEKEAALLANLHSNHERVVFIRKHINKLGEEKFSNVISNNNEEKPVVHPSNDKLNTIEKK